MKIIFCTTPIRPIPTDYPPVAVTALMDHLAANGYDSSFYDIDALRPKFDDVVEYFRREQPDILGVSAVVSTSYRYVKNLTHAVKKVSPHTKIILGGNLAASSEILFRKTPVDVTVVGEGEKVMMNLVRYFEKHGNFKPSPELRLIKGISYLDGVDMVFTGYESALNDNELRQPNFDILKKYSKLETFIHEPKNYPAFEQDPRFHRADRKGKKFAIVLTAKGCVARCTFCHRWDKGYRTHNVQKIVDHMRYLKEKHDVHFFSMGDENFGSDREHLDAFIEAVKPLDILFSVSGIRVTTVDKNPTIIRRMREAGCVAMIFGMETGSPKMLSVMEKGAQLEQNLRVVRQLVAEGMYTIVQLVLGMPGENDETVAETIEFVKAATENMDEIPFERLSVNLFQALPGTPGYEFARSRGLIGKTLDDEEAYLLKVSDVDACTWEHYQNVSEASRERVMTWGQRIIRQATIHWYAKRGWKPLKNTAELEAGRVKDYARGGYFRILKPGKTRGVGYWRLYGMLRPFIERLTLFRMRSILYGYAGAVKITLKLQAEEDRSKFLILTPQSLRKIVAHPTPETRSVTEASMQPLRMGR